MAKKGVKKVTTRKASRKKKASAVSASVGPAVKGKAWTQAQTIRHLAETSGLPATQAKALFAELSVVAERHLKKGSVGTFTIPGLARLRVTMRPKTKTRQGRNPFTGEEITIPAKPARRALRARPVKAIKDKVEGK